MTFEELSDDAKCVAAAWFPAQVEVNFAMKQRKPSPRAQAALDELVAGKFITVDNSRPPAVTYRCVTMQLVPARQWLFANLDFVQHDFDLVVPVDAQ